MTKEPPDARLAGPTRGQPADGRPLLSPLRPPDPVAWFRPRELLRTAYHVGLSTLATGYLDRRETLAALDREGPLPATMLSYGSPETQSALPRTTELDSHYGPVGTCYEIGQDPDRVLWIDFVADLGDSWDATYATAMLMASETLKVKGIEESLPRAHVAVLGGDLVYPTPRRDQYRDRLRRPFAAAFPAIRETNGAQPLAPSLLALPGNHDWYDGLTNFVREFCQGGVLGAWHLVQRRSYFAVKLTHGWWLWGIDIALDTRIDAPQQAYFLNLLKNPTSTAGEGTAPNAASQYRKGDRIILCTAKPSWLRDPRHSDDAFLNLTYFVRTVIEAHDASAPVILSGDLHQYCRYESKDGGQLIVSGGGGAYLVGTHHLPRRIKQPRQVGFEETPPDPARSEAPSAPARDGKPEYVLQPFPYPTASDSRWLALRATLLAFRPANISFCLVVGALCWLMAWPLREVMATQRTTSAPTLPPITAAPWTDLESYVQHGVELTRVVSWTVAIVALCVAFAVFGNRGNRIWLALWGALHALVQLFTAVAVVWMMRPDSRPGRFWSGLFDNLLLREGAEALVYLVVAGYAAATIVGLYLVASDAWFGCHRNEVFSAQSIIDYRNFLRLRIDRDGAVWLYPIALRRVPRKWRGRVNRKPHEPRYEPADATLTPHLIEGPVRIAPPAPSR